MPDIFPLVIDFLRCARNGCTFREGSATPHTPITAANATGSATVLVLTYFYYKNMRDFLIHSKVYDELFTEASRKREATEAM